MSTPLDPQPDFVLFGGDLAQFGQKEELRLGAEILKEVKAPVKAMVGEHDWFLDMGETWQDLFGPPNYSFDWKGVHFVTIMSVNEKDFWTARHMTPEERMHTVAGLDNGVQSRFEVGDGGRDWLKNDLSKVPTGTPLVIFSHFPALQILSPLEFLDRGCRRGAGNPAAVQDGHRHPWSYASIAVQPDRQHLVPRHALDRVAVALLTGGPAKADDPDGAGRPVRSV
jgi:3',5'-cyclic AMP phosphodiesterase CpdA